MKKSLTLFVVAVLLLTLVLPAVALAGGGRGGGPKGKGQAAKAERSAAKESRKSDKAAEKASKADEKAAAKAARKVPPVASVAVESEVSSPSTDASPSTEATKAVGAGVRNALARITRNIQRKIEKYGESAMVPSGLMSVWLKFASWLGDTSLAPWLDDGTSDGGVTPSTETSPSVPASTDSSTTPTLLPPGVPVL